MGQTRFSQILGTSVVVVLLAGLVWGVHSKIKQAIATQTKTTTVLCLPLTPQTQRCYPTETVLSTQATTAIATDATGSLMVSSNRAKIDVWNLATGKQVRSLHDHSQWVTALAISPDGKILASSSLDGTIKLWHLATGTLQVSLPAKHVTALAFSPDGRILASGSRLVGAVYPPRFYPLQLWDVNAGLLLKNLDPGQPITAIAFNPNGQQLAAGSASASVWDVPTQTRLYQVNSGDLNALIFSADGRLLLTGSDGVRGEDGIKMWATATGKQERVLDSVASDFALSPNGALLLTTYGGTTNIWRMQPFGYLGTLRGSIYSGMVAKFGLNGRAIATGSSDGVKVWRPEPSDR